MTDVAHRSRRLLWTVIFAILLLGFASFYYFKQHNTSQYNQLKSVQLEFKQALDNTDNIQTEHLQDLTQKIIVIKSSVDKDIPQDLQKQYDEIITKLSQLTSSSDSALSSVVQDLLSQLTNQAGEGIGLEGKNNTVIVNKGVTDVNGKTGSVTVQGTSNQTNVSTNGNTVTVGTAQDISQNSSPTFNNQTLNGNQNVVGNSTIQGSGSVSGNVFVGGNTSTNTLTIQSGGTQNGYALCDASNNCGYSGAGSSYVQGGNSFGNPAVIGTNDNNSLNLRTKGINRITIDTSGNSSFSGNINTLGSLSAGSLSGNGSGLTNVDAGALNGNVAGNNSGQIALNNSTLNSNLNADLLDGQHGSYYQNASNLNSGTVADSRLSSNVALQNTSNIFSLQQTFSSGFQGTAGSLSGSLTVSGAATLQGLTATGILQNGYQVCDSSNNCNYSPSSGGAGYIQNQTATPQTAGFNINGNGYIAGSVGIGTTSPSVRLSVVASNSGAAMFNSGTITAAGNTVEIQGSLSRSSTATTYGSALSIQNTIAPATGQSNLSFVDINGTVNQGTATGITRGVYVRPTLTSALDFRAIDIANVSGYGLYQSSANLINYLNGKVGIGTLTPNQSLEVLGNGLFSGSVTGVSLFQGANQVCDTSNNCSYASSSGSAGYIQNQTATSQAAGFNISGNGTIGGALLVQGGISSPGIGSQSEVFGYGASAAGNRSLAIGNGATATVVSNGASGAIAIGYGAIAHQHANSGSVAIGYLASSTDFGSVALGQNAAANSQSSIAIGVSSTGATSGVAIGANATVGGAGSIAIGSSASSVQSGQGGGIAIGLSSNVTNAYSIAIGRASVSAYSNSIVLGHSAVSTAANQLVIGGATTISQGYIGNGVTATSPQSFTLNATGGSGTDIQGANIAIAGGRGTGSAAGGNILFQTSAAGTSGTTLNALSERMRITSNGDIGINNTNPQSVIDVGARSSTDSAYMSLRSGSTSSVRSAVRFYQGTTEYGNVGFVSSTNLTLQGLNRNITVATSTNNSSIELATCSACASSSDSTRHRLLVTTSGLSYQDGNNVAYMTLNRTSGTFAQAISIGTTSNMGQLGILNNNASQVGLAVQAASGQTANIQEWRDSNGANLLAVDSGGVLWGRDLTSGFRGSLDLQSSNNALILRNTNTQAFRIGFIGPNDAELSYGGRVNVNGLYTFSGNYVSFSNNIRGYNVAVSASSTEKTVTFATAHANANYAVFCTPNWNTSCYVTDKTTTGFKLNYGTPAPSGQLVDWFVAR